MDDRRAPCSSEQLQRYLQRIGHGGTPHADEATLVALHTAHLAAIAFENLEIHLGRPMRIDPDALFTDLVARRRGGYCFQMNELFARALLAIGFEVERFAARVWLRNPTPMPPRAHQLLRVTTQGGNSFLCDVGFGGGSPWRPLPWELERIDEQPLASYRLRADRHLGVILQVRSAEPDTEAWTDMVSFAIDDQHPVDFKYANHAISTMPDSRFVMHRIVARTEEALRQTLFDGVYRETTPRGVTERELDATEEERALREVFGLDLPEPLEWQSRAAQ